MTIFNFLLDRASRRQINEILAVPRYTRAEMLSFTEPRIDSSQLTNWLRRGFLDLKWQMTVGTPAELLALAGRLEKNEKLGTRRRYTGGDILKCMVLNVIGQSGAPFALASRILEIVLKRAGSVLMKAPADEFVIRISIDPRGDYHAEAVNATDRNGEGEWRLIIEMDRIIARFLKASVPSDLNDALRPRPGSDDK